jgi:hypothetical protein
MIAPDYIIYSYSTTGGETFYVTRIGYGTGDVRTVKR